MPHLTEQQKTINNAINSNEEDADIEKIASHISTDQETENLVVGNIIKEQSKKDAKQAKSELHELKKGSFDQMMIGGKEQKKVEVVAKVAEPVVTPKVVVQAKTTPVNATAFSAPVNATAFAAPVNATAFAQVKK